MSAETVHDPEDKPWKLKRKKGTNQVQVDTDDDLTPQQEINALSEAIKKLEEIKNSDNPSQILNQINNDRTDATASGSNYR